MQQQQQYYKLIYDANLVAKHAEMFLNDNNNNVYFVALFSRRKYGDISTATQVLQQNVITEPNNQLLNTIKRYEVQVECYTDKITRKPIPNDALVIYLNINPRSMLKASTNFSNHITHLFAETITNNNSNNNSQFKHLLSKFRSFIHASQISQPPYIELDIDTKDRAWLQKMKERVLQPITQYIVCIIETRGGYHIVLNNRTITKQIKSQLYMNIHRDKSFEFTENGVVKKYIELHSDPSPPVPGTIQGGFPVKYITYDELFSQTR